VAYATNPIDGVRTYFEDPGGDAPPVLFYSGFPDSVEYSKTLGIAKALQRDLRVIFCDHRGLGRSDKPHNVAAYALRTRAADVVAVLDELGIDRAHYVGVSWGARLGYAVGEYASDRVHSLVLWGNQPYAWDTTSPLYHGIARAMEALRRDGIDAFVESWESSIGERFPEPGRSMIFDNDPLAIDAAFDAAIEEGPVSKDLGAWQVPCLVCIGEADDMRADAERGAAEIPGAELLVLGRQTHFSAERVVERVHEAILALFRRATAGR
jgi:pimeloyl-ACP methyl ester carboxylesterase